MWRTPIPSVCVFPRCSGHGHAHPHRSPSNLFCSLDINILHSFQSQKSPFKTIYYVLYCTSGVEKHFGATSGILFTEVRPRYASFLSSNCFIPPPDVLTAGGLGVPSYIRYWLSSNSFRCLIYQLMMCSECRGCSLFARHYCFLFQTTRS